MNTNAILYYTCAIGSGVFWMLAYVAIIGRGFKDHSFGMPIIALSANASWEAIFSFIYIPPNKLLHYSSIAWFIFDLPIVLQCFLYGANDFKSQFIKNNFRVIFLAAIAISFAVLFNSIYEFDDIRGVYSGFGINFMMSILYIGILVRRDDILGQSLYIALFKWMGTWFAFLSLLFPLLPKDTDVPLNIQLLLTRIISEQSYPLTSLIKTIYFIVFLFDILYIILLYHKCREKNINPWTRF